MAGLAVKLERIRNPESLEAQDLIRELTEKLSKYGIDIQRGVLGNLVATLDLVRLIQFIESEAQNRQALLVAA